MGAFKYGRIVDGGNFKTLPRASCDARQGDGVVRVAKRGRLWYGAGMTAPAIPASAP